jgi:hypothetical protein
LQARGAGLYVAEWAARRTLDFLPIAALRCVAGECRQRHFFNFRHQAPAQLRGLSARIVCRDRAASFNEQCRSTNNIGALEHCPGQHQQNLIGEPGVFRNFATTTGA